LTPKHSRIIGTVLSPALHLWLRSQVSQVADLHVEIAGGDRQIISGHIPQVNLAARHAVYQGLHLSQIRVTGENIRINLGQVLRGQPLRLLEPIPVTAELFLEEADLKASLGSSLLSNALTELFKTLLTPSVTTILTDPSSDGNISWSKVAIAENLLSLEGAIMRVDGESTPVLVKTGIQLASGRELRLAPLQIYIAGELVERDLDSFPIDLGAEVDFKELALTAGQLIARGSIKVMP
jgi:hypothetical protein